MAWEQNEIRNLKVNHYIVIDDEPCRIKKIDTSKPGKHGESKARLEATGLFDGKKHSLISPVTHKVKVPIIEKNKGQVVSMSGDEVKIMDLTTYDIFTLQVDDSEIMENIEQGQEIDYMETMGRKKITRV